MRVTFDSNILVYAIDTEAGAKRSTALDLIGRAVDADCVFILQSLAEFFFVATRKAGLDAAAGAEFVNGWREIFPVRAAGEGALALAMEAVRDHQLSFWDAMLWATARQANCQLLVSEDFQDGRTLEGVTFVDPFMSGNAALLESALPRRT